MQKSASNASQISPCEAQFPKDASKYSPALQAFYSNKEAVALQVNLISKISFPSTIPLSFKLWKKDKEKINHFVEAVKQYSL